MKWVVPSLYFLLVIIVSSCQRELDIDLQKPTSGDSTITVTPVFKIVEIDLNYPDDSIIHILKRVEGNGEKTVVMAEIFSGDPTDTLITIFSYDGQNRINSIESGGQVSSPFYFPYKYKFTWAGGRLTRVACDTAGVFANSFDYNYTPNGANTIVIDVRTPSIDLIAPDYFSKTKHSVTVNAQFIPISEQWITHGFNSSGNSDPALPQNVHDTASNYFTYAGADLTSYVTHSSRHDTNVSIFPFTNIIRDTQNMVYTRATGTTNISDSLKKIYGAEVYTLMNFDLLDFYYSPWIVSSHDQDKSFLARPLQRQVYSSRVWINGVYDAGNSHSNFLVRKMDNSFDPSGRLTQAILYMDHSEVDMRYLIKVYY